MPKIASAERGELVSVRVSPKTKFSLELLSRIQRRTISAIVQMAIERELNREDSRLFVDVPRTVSGGSTGCGVRGNVNGKDSRYLPDRLWDPIEPDRIVKLAQYNPDLLTHQEQLIWKAIRENPRLWKKQGTTEEVDFEVIRREWPAIKRQANEWDELG